MPNTKNIESFVDRIHLVDGDLHDQASLETALKTSEPDEVYNLAAQSFVGVSFSQPVVTGEVTGIGVVRLLEAVRHRADKARFYQAASSEMFGNAPVTPQDERTPFHPRSPYGVAKVYAYWACVNYRESYGMFAVNGILYNHESERRGLEFVTRKISNGVARIKLGKATKLQLGTLTTKRDWGYAPEYTELMWRMLQHGHPEDFVGATGESHTVGEFAELAFDRIGIKDWKSYVVIDKRYSRPAEVDVLCGNASKARDRLGWIPKVSFKQLVEKMVDNDIRTTSASLQP